MDSKTLKRTTLENFEHSYRKGEAPADAEPNVRESCLLCDPCGEIIGFYLTKGDLSPEMRNVASVCNKELRSKRVPKSEMLRVTTDGFDEEKGQYRYKDEVPQWSTILGSIPAKPHMRRLYNSVSAVHSVPSAQTYIKAMAVLCRMAEDLVEKHMPGQLARQQALVEAATLEKYRFGRMFTSSIANFNISAAYHQDVGNIIGCVNVIITKRLNAGGGNLHVPDHGVVFDQSDDSMLVYPAWRNLHGVTPIHAHHPGGYRNTLIFYALKGFHREHVYDQNSQRENL